MLKPSGLARMDPRRAKIYSAVKVVDVMMLNRETVNWKENAPSRYQLAWKSGPWSHVLHLYVCDMICERKKGVGRKGWSDDSKKGLVAEIGKCACP